MYYIRKLLNFKFRVLKRRGYKVKSPITANGDFLKYLKNNTEVLTSH